MSGFLSIEVSDNVPISLQLIDGNEDQYPQAEVRDNDETLLTTINLSHSAAGVYIPSTPYTMPDVDFIIITYKTYTNAGHTTESDKYTRDTDIFYKFVVETNTESLSGDIADIKANTETIINDLDAVELDVKRLLGLTHENSIIDNAIYDRWDNLQSARMRLYSDSVSVGTENNIIATYMITADTTAVGKFNTWKQVKQ